MSWYTLELSLLATWVAARVGRAGAREARALLALGLLAPFVRLPSEAGAFVSAPARVEAVAPVLGAVSAAVSRAAPVVDAWSPDIALAVAFVGLARLMWAAWSLRRALAGGVLLHDLYGVRVYAVPGQHFAAWWGGRIVAVDPDFDRLALRHELQHHRHGDPVRAWALLLLGVVAEPMAGLWRRLLSGEEELAVDRAVVARGADARRYARTLVAHAGPAFAPALARSLLHRRIHMLLSARPRRSFATLLAVPLLGLAMAAAPPTLSPVAPLPQGQEMNELISAQLERYTTGPGRAWAEGALSRRDPALRGRLEAAGLPGWLEAVAFVESGFRADIVSQYPLSGPSAGYWQFIPSTARTYGLRVDGSVDERLDVEASTAAAITLLHDLHRWNGGDWGLALASYNQGQDVVKKAVAREGTRDVWELQRRGALNGYVAMVYAAAALLE